MKIDDLIDRSRGHGFGTGPLRRVVVRIDRATIARIDALRSHFPASTRASLIRAFCVAGLMLAEDAAKMPGGAP